MIRPLRKSTLGVPRTLVHLLLGVTLTGATAFAGSNGETQDPPDEGQYLPGSQLVGRIGDLSEGALEFRIADPEFGEFAFEGYAKPMEEYPGSLRVQESPLGGVILYATGTEDAPEYILYLESSGAWTTLAASPTGDSYQGAYGSTSVAVTQADIAQDPGGPTVSGGGTADRVPGWNIIRIASPCPNAQFRQFVTVDVKWKGTKPGPNGPVNVSGSGGVREPMTGNNGQDVNMDGSTTYVDSNRGATGANTPPGFNPTPDGNYPAENSGSGGTYMEDAPNIPTNPSGIVGDIQTANPGVTVTEITVTLRYTAYVICDGIITHKVKWCMVETVKVPPAPGSHPYGPSGGFGGPGIGPGQAPFTAGGIPTVEPATDMEPHHTAAYGGYMGGNYNGAPNGGAAY